MFPLNTLSYLVSIIVPITIAILTCLIKFFILFSPTHTHTYFNYTWSPILNAYYNALQWKQSEQEKWILEIGSFHMRLVRSLSSMYIIGSTRTLIYGIWSFWLLSPFVAPHSPNDGKWLEKKTTVKDFILLFVSVRQPGQLLLYRYCICIVHIFSMLSPLLDACFLLLFPQFLWTPKFFGT